MAKPPIGFNVDKANRTVTADIQWASQYGTNVPNSGKIEREDGLSIADYKKMLRDETIRENHEFVAFSVLSRIGDYHHDDQKLKDFVDAAFEQMRGSIYDVFREILFGIPFGFSVGEPTYLLDGRTTLLGKVDFYDPESIEFKAVTKKESEEGLGFSGDLHPTEGIKQTATGGQSYIPTPKALVYVPDKRWGNWYGSPTLRGAYKWWNFTEMVPRWYAISLEKYSIPILSASVTPDLYNQTITKDGTEYGPNAEKSILDLAVKILDEIYGGRSVAVPDGMIITQITSNAQIAADFRGAIDFANKMKNRAQLIPDLLAGQGQGTGTYAMADAHQAFYFQLIDWRITQVTELVLDRLVRPLIEFNFGPQDDWGIFQKRNPGQKQIEVEARVVKELTEAGYLSPETHGEQVRQRLEFEESTTKPENGAEPVLPSKEEDPKIPIPKLADDPPIEDPLEPANIPPETRPILELFKTLEERALSDLTTITRKQAEALVRLANRIKPEAIPDLEIPNARDLRRAWAEHLVETYRAFRKQAALSLPAAARPEPTQVQRPLADALKRKAYVIADTMADDIKAITKSVMLRGLEQGKGVSEIAFDLQQAFEPYIHRPDVLEADLQKAAKLQSIVRDTFTDVANDARIEVGRESSNVVAYRYQTIEDGRRSDVCKGLDGMVVAVDDPIVKVIKPKNHWGCRSMLGYVLRGEEYALTPRDQVLRAAAKIPAQFR